MVLKIGGLLVALIAVNFIPMAWLHTPGMNEYEMSGITTYAVSSDKQAAEAIADRVASSQDRILQAMGNIDTSGIDIIVYPDRSALKRKTLGFAGILLLPDWFIGRNTMNSVLITSPQAPGPEHTYESVVQAAVHEYVHVLTYRVNRNLDHWLMEGIAVYLAQQVPSDGMVRDTAEAITYERFAKTNSIQFANVGGYALSYTLIAYIEETYGWDKVMALIEPGATYESVLGRSKRDVFEAWRSHLLGE